MESKASSLATLRSSRATPMVHTRYAPKTPATAVAASSGTLKTRRVLRRRKTCAHTRSPTSAAAMSPTTPSAPSLRSCWRWYSRSSEAKFTASSAAAAGSMRWCIRSVAVR